MGSHQKDKNALLVNPWIVDFKAFDFWLKPLGLLYIASILEQNHWNINFIDCMDRHHPSVEGKIHFRPDGTGKFTFLEISKPDFYKNIPRKYKIYGIPIEAFTQELEKIPKPDIILVTSVMTYWYPGVHKAISILKDRFPYVPVILGGIYASLCTDFAVEHSGADVVVQGFNVGEFLEFIRNPAIGKQRKTMYLSSSDHIGELPYPAFHLYKKLDYYTIITSRGCPFRCTYCASFKLYPSFTQREPDDVFNEILNAHQRLGINKFAFYDDALLVNQEKHIIPILEKVLKLGLKFKFYTPNGLHARYITQHLANLMYKTGFDQLRISLESSDESLLKSTGGKVTVGELERAVRYLLSAGFHPSQIGVYLMMGIPGQKRQDVEKALDLVHNLGVQIRLSSFSPVPGTGDFERIRIPYKDEPLFHNNTFHHYLDCTCSGGFSVEEKEKLKNMAFQMNKKLVMQV